MKFPARKFAPAVCSAVFAGMAPFPIFAGCYSNTPPVRAIDRTTLPAGNPRYDLPLYQGELGIKYQEIAVVDSFISYDKKPETVKAQLKDLQNKGIATGADALIRVRPLTREVTGWQENPRTPFWSVKQGKSSDHFFRATAIHYLQPVHGEPPSLPMKAEHKSRKGETVTPLVDMNRILKTNRNNSRPANVSVPEVQTTQQMPGNH